MKYSIQESGAPHFQNKLMRYGEHIGMPNNCEYEFWMRIQQLEECLSHIYHYTSCTTRQIELINAILPQE